LRRLQAKQARAERQRIEYQTERARKIHLLLAKVEEVKVSYGLVFFQSYEGESQTAFFIRG
jgi:hypothetical protein